MTGPRIKALGLAAMGAAMIAGFSGCDASEDADLDNGRELFSAQCGQCHALAEAPTTGVIGPDLDASFAAARNDGMDQDTIEGVVEAQIENPRKVDPEDPSYMPPDLVEGDDVADVAAYVASVAGVPNIEPPQAPDGTEGGQIFLNSGCGSCHVLAAVESGGAVGPNLDENLPGQSAAQIEESIVDPSAEIVAGFDDLMPPDYGESIAPDDLETLVKYLEETAGQSPGGASGGSGG